ncbi:translocation/assembly module TamB domain-containing protein [Alkaliflexus imshenetskii]|uniref:translocation/assembly module TamB domain-containing protein n=1 Tax=Alkaliflexus imshenetskii TaxID=286730 RepID=UPI00047B5394|nr:translocation/assembly module TamB domain-containing protein [Alkaliflexus imshenetskii]
MRKALNIILWFFLSLFLLVMGALAVTQTAWFRNFVKEKAIEIAGENINGAIHVDEIRGNFFTNLEIRNLSVLFLDGDTLISFDALKLRYTPLALLKKQIKIDEIELLRPRVNIELDQDSVWNFSRLIRPSETPADTTAAAPFPYSVRLQALLITEGEVHLNIPESLAPGRIDNLTLNLSAFYSSNELALNLKTFSFESHAPNLILKNFTVNIQSDFEQWVISDFRLTTALNEINLDARYKDLDAFNAQLEWPDIHMKEFDFILPDIKLPATPDLHFEATNQDDTLKFRIRVAHSNESIALNGMVKQFSALLSDSLRHTVPVDLNLDIRNLRPNNWIETEPIPLVLNTQLNIRGNGIKKSSPPLTISGNMHGTSWENYFLERGLMELRYAAGKTNANIRISGVFGALDLLADFDLNTPNGPFKAELSTKNLALHTIVPQYADSTLLTLYLNATGQGIASEQRSAKFNAKISQSIIEHIPVDSLTFFGHYENKRLTLDTLSISNQSLTAQLNAIYDFEGNVRAHLKGKIANTSAFEHYVTQPVSWDTLTVDAKLGGRTDSLTFNLHAIASHIEMDTTLTVNHLHLNSDGLWQKNTPFVNALINASGFEISGFKSDSLRINASLADSLWATELIAYLPADYIIDLAARGNLGDVMDVMLEKLSLTTPFAHLQTSDTPARITYSDKRVAVNDFILNDKRDALFQLGIDAVYQQGDSIRLNARIKDFNMEMLSMFGLSEQYMKGRATLNLDVNGNHQSFTINGNTSLVNIEADPLAISGFKANLHFPGDTAHIRAAIYNATGDSIQIRAASPLTISLNDSLLISWPKTFKAHLLASNTRLSGFFQTMPGVQQPKALLSFDIAGEGHVSSPIIKGKIDITNGELPLPKYGIDYKDLHLKLSIDDTQILIDTIFARHFNGTLLASGVVEMDSSLFTGKMKSANMNLRANQFYLTRHRDFQIQIDADAFFRDVDHNPRFGGNIKVLRSSFNLPAIMKLAHESADLNDPLLVQALKERSGDVILTDTTLTVRQRTEPKSGIMEQVTGTIRLDVPRNTWLRSPDMQMELYGNLDVVKNSEAFELFGTLGVHRGFYTLYGKKLNVREGELTFTGGDAFDPQLNLRAAYAFRTRDRLKRELMLIVGGRASDPDIQFELDRQSIPEADAMAYLLFGQPFDELSYGNQEGVSNAVPSRLLTGLVSSQLSKTIGSTFNLDMIEIDAGDNWQNTTFMVGKYITNNLFVTYQRSFGQSGQDAITPETITLEYELSRRLSLRLMHGDVKDSGVDVIIKFER